VILNGASVFFLAQSLMQCCTLQVQGVVTVAMPLRACESLVNTEDLTDKIVMAERGDCMFVDKVACCCLFIHLFPRTQTPNI